MYVCSNRKHNIVHVSLNLISLFRLQNRIRQSCNYFARILKVKKSCSCTITEWFSVICNSMVNEQPSFRCLNWRNTSANLTILPRIFTLHDNLLMDLLIIMIPVLRVNHLVKAVEVINLNIWLNTVNVHNLAVNTLRQNKCVLIPIIARNNSNRLYFLKILGSCHTYTADFQIVSYEENNILSFKFYDSRILCINRSFRIFNIVLN